MIGAYNGLLFFIRIWPRELDLQFDTPKRTAEKESGFSIALRPGDSCE